MGVYRHSPIHLQFVVHGQLYVFYKLIFAEKIENNLYCYISMSCLFHHSSMLIETGDL